MKIKKSSLPQKILAFIRFLFVKVFLSGKISLNGLTYLGSGIKLISNKNGKIKLGKKIHLSDRIELQSSGILSIGDNTTINSYSRIIAFESIKMGKNCTLAQFVSILDHDHDYEKKDDQMILNDYKTDAVSIGDNVWIGDKVTILKGVSIGNNVIVGANSLVIKDIPSNSIVGGVPAKIIKEI